MRTARGFVLKLVISNSNSLTPVLLDQVDLSVFVPNPIGSLHETDPPGILYYNNVEDLKASGGHTYKVRGEKRNNRMWIIVEFTRNGTNYAVVGHNTLSIIHN